MRQGETIHMRVRPLATQQLPAYLQLHASRTPQAKTNSQNSLSRSLPDENKNVHALQEEAMPQIHVHALTIARWKAERLAKETVAFLRPIMHESFGISEIDFMSFDTTLNKPRLIWVGCIEPVNVTSSIFQRNSRQGKSSTYFSAFFFWNHLIFLKYGRSCRRKLHLFQEVPAPPNMSTSKLIFHLLQLLAPTLLIIACISTLFPYYNHFFTA